MRARSCTIVMVTYNSAADLDGFFDGLVEAAPGVDLRIVVVDNGSSDATLDVLPERPDLTVVETGANLGYAGGINVGRRHASVGVPLLIANPDMRFAPGSIRRLIDALDDATVAVAVPRLVGPDGATRRSVRNFPSITREVGEMAFGDRWPNRPAALCEMVRDERRYRCDHDVDWATGAAMLVSPRCDEVVGVWDERYFLYSEEVDYAMRLREAGLRMRFVPDAVAMHREGGSGRSQDLIALSAVNRVRWAERFHSRAWSATYRVAVVAHELTRRRRRSAAIVANRRSWSDLIPGIR